MKNSLITITLVVFIALSSFGQTYEFDPGHTFVNFSVERFATVDVSGRFNDFRGNLEYDETNHKIVSAEFTIEVKSIDSGHEIRDGHLKGEIWLHAEKYPTISFRTKSVESSSDGFVAIGDLMIHGVSKEIRLPFEIKGPAVDPTKNTTIGISTQLVINRQDYGISFSRLMDNGNMFIGNDVEITINALAQLGK